MSEFKPSDEVAAKIKAVLTAEAKKNQCGREATLQRLINLLPQETVADLRAHEASDIVIAYIAHQVSEGVSFEQVLAEVNDDNEPYNDKPAFQEALHALELISNARKRHYSKLSPIAKMYFLALVNGDEYKELRNFVNPLEWMMGRDTYLERIEALRKDLRMPGLSEDTPSRSNLVSGLEADSRLRTLRPKVSKEDYDILKDSFFTDVPAFAKVLSKYNLDIYNEEPVVDCLKMTAYNILSYKGIYFTHKRTGVPFTVVDAPFKDEKTFRRPLPFSGNEEIFKGKFLSATPNLKRKVTNFLNGSGYKYTIEIKDMSTAEDLNSQLNGIIKSEIPAEELEKFPNILTRNPFAMHL